MACGPHGDGSPDTPRVPADWWCFGAPPCEATGPCEVATCDWETGTCVSAAATAPATGALSPECLEVEVAVNPCDGSRPREAPATACFIAGVCVPDQTPFPLDPCQVCDAATAPFDWVAADCQGCEPGVGCPAPDGGTDEAACQPGELVSPCVECDPIGAPTLDRACDDGDACTEDECRPDVGCVFIPTPGGCDDQDDCTVDQCDPVAGCVHLPRPCDDGEPCTHDGCDPTTGCHHRAAPCPDGGACLVARCAEGGGCALVGLTCDDGDPCTVDSCGAVTGCTSTPLTCDDGDACTVDLCDAAGCHHTRRLCDDGDACTADSCDAGTGCAHPPWPCDDGDACTDDECSAGSCLHAPSDCDDGDACTVDQCDPAAGCVTGAVDCHDGNSCTLDGCDPVLGCSWSPAPGGCEDGDACTTPDVCVDGVCQGGPRDGAQLDVDFETLTGTGFADAAPPAEDAEVLGSPPGQVVVTTAAGATALVAPDPSTSTVRADLPTSTSTAAWTFLAWLEPQASGSGQALGQLASRRLIPKNPASAETRWLTFYTGDFPGGATADPDDLVGVTLPGPGASRQLAAVTYDGATLRGYFDFDALVAGAEVADVELPKNLAPWTFGPALWLGARPQGATPPTDRPIDRVVWFDRALAPAELVHVATADPWAAPLCGGCDPEDSCPTFVTSACWQTACQPAHGGCVSLPDGLVASYDLEAVVDAEVPDGTGHGHTAVNVGGTAVLGVGEGLALAFAGGGTGCASGLVIPTAGGLGAPSFTLSLWWRHQGAGGGATSEVVAEVPLRDADQSPWTARLSVEALTWGPAVYSSPGGLGLADGQWHHVALSHGPAGVQVLVDGAAVTLCAVADVAQGCEAVVPPWRPDLQAAAEPTAACGADGVDAAAAVDDVRWHLRGLDEPTIGRLLAGVVDLCDDGDPCTLDGCSPFLGCLHGDVPCDDASACTVDSCDAEGACVHEPTVSCDDDGEPCTDERCDPASGGCVTTPNTAPCDDGDPCTVGDRCGAGACGALLHAPCDDDLPCSPQSGPCWRSPAATRARAAPTRPVSATTGTPARQTRATPRPAPAPSSRPATSAIPAP